MTAKRTVAFARSHRFLKGQSHFSSTSQVTRSALRCITLFCILLLSFLIWPLTEAGVAADEPKPSSAAVVVIDTSGSVKHVLDDITAAASLFTAGCDSSITVELVPFHTKASVLGGGLAPATPSRRRMLLGSLAGLQAVGNTDILGAGLTATEMLSHCEARQKWMLLLTDGQQTEAIPAALAKNLPAGANAQEQIRLAGKVLAQRAKSQSIRIFAIGLGNQVDRELLESLAIGSGGVFLEVDQPTKLLPVYVDWLRAVGDYYVAKQTDRVAVVPGDRDLKILAALPTTQIQSLKRDGREVTFSKDGFESWVDQRQYLQVIQATDPPAGSYLVHFTKNTGPKDQIFFLKRSPQRWNVKIKHQSEGLLQPLEIEACADPTPEKSEDWKVDVTINDTRGEKMSQGKMALQRRLDGTFQGSFFLDAKSKVQQPGTYNVRVSIVDQKSGWGTEHTETIHFKPGLPEVFARIETPKNASVTAQMGSAIVDIGFQEPGSKTTVVLHLRSSPSASGVVLELPVLSESHGLNVMGPQTITLNGSEQRIDLVVFSPSPFLKGPAIARIRLVAPKHDSKVVKINGSPEPIDFHFTARPKTEDIHLLIYPPKFAPEIACGQQLVWHCKCKLEGKSSSKVKIEATLSWSPRSVSGPKLGFGETGQNGMRLELPLAASLQIPVLVRVPVDSVPGSYQAELTLRVLAEKPVSINGKLAIKIPLVFHAVPAVVGLQFFDANGIPLNGNIYKYQILSPIKTRKETLRLQMTGEAAKQEWQFHLVQSEIDSVRCGFNQNLPRSQDEPSQLEIHLTVAAQAPPGTRRFVFVVEPGPGVVLTPDSRQFVLEVEIPQVKLVVRSASGISTNYQYQLGYFEWLRLKIFNEPIVWRDNLSFEIDPSGLANDVDFGLVDFDFGETSGNLQWEESVGGAGDSGSVAFTGTLSKSGSYPLVARLYCPYRHVQVVDAEGNPLATSGDGKKLIVGNLNVLPPPLIWPVLVGFTAVGLIILDRFRRRCVPGQFFVKGGKHNSFEEKSEKIRLGRRRCHIRVGGQTLAIRRRWSTVWLRWVKKSTESAVSVECPNGHERHLDFRGRWEPLCDGDVIHVDMAEAEYIAPIQRHCQYSATRSQNNLDEDVFSWTDQCEDW